MISLYLPSETKMGVGYQAHAMANAFVARGHSVTVFSACAKADGARYDYQRVDVGNSLRTFRFAWNLRKIDFSGFDIIHAHGDNYWLWSRRNRPPVVRTMHGSCLVEAWKVPGVKEKLRMLLLYAAEVLATLVADKTVCVSTDTLRYYPGLRTVIPNGVNVAAFGGATSNEQRVPARREATTAGGIQRTTSPGVPGKELESVQSVKSVDQDSEPRTLNLEVNKESAALPDNLIIEKPSVAKSTSVSSATSVVSNSFVSSCLRGKSPIPTILFVGTYGNRKRGKLLMEIFARDIRPALPEAQLWMVCSDAPAAEGVTVFGRVPERQLTDLYRRAWVFCLPSTYEGFGIPYIEAMASGTAVVASPNVGAVEVTRNGTDGLIAPDDKLGETLLRVLRDDSLRHKLEAAGRERVKDFDLNKVCEQYEEIYRKLMDKRSGSPQSLKGTKDDDGDLPQRHKDTKDDDGVHHKDTKTSRYQGE